MDPVPVGFAGAGACRDPLGRQSGDRDVNRCSGTAISLTDVAHLGAGSWENVKPFDASACSGSARMYTTGGCRSTTQTESITLVTFMVLIMRMSCWTPPACHRAPSSYIKLQLICKD